MNRIIRSHERHHVDAGWLSARWHFSFSDYYDPENVSFEPLRVFNDDVIQPDSGFPLHPHREMEIITYVLSGQLEHRDSSGGHGILRAGDVQRMSAGTGIRHSEANPSTTEPVRLLQIWIQPAQHGATPSYEQGHVDLQSRTGRWVQIAGGEPADGALRIGQDASLWVGRFDAGTTVQYPLAGGRRAYLYVIEGQVTVNGHTLNQGDQARLEDARELHLESAAPSHVLLIDLP